MIRFDHWSFYWIFFVVLFSSAAIFRPRMFALILPLVFFWTARAFFLIDWSVLKLVLFLFLISIALNGFPRQISSLPNRKALIVFILLFGAWSVYAAFHVPESALIGVVRSAVHRPPLRGIVRTFYFMSFILALPIAFWGIHGKADFSKVLRIFFITALVAAIVGVVEMFAVRFVPSLDNLWRFFNVGNVVEIVGEKKTFTSCRPCPFVYEPRYFGYAMGFTACLAFLCRIFPVSGVPKWATRIPFIGTCFLLSLASASVSAVAGVLFGFTAITVWLVACKRIVQKHKLKYVFFFIILVLIFLLNTQLLQHRLYGYLFSAGLADESGLTKNAFESQRGMLSTNAYLYWFINQPKYLLIGSGFGNGCFYCFKFLPYFSGWLEAGFLTARLPIIDLISDIGILGMLFLFGLWIRWWRKIGTLSKQTEDVESMHCLEIICGILLFLIISGFWFETHVLTWFFFGVALALTAANNPEADYDDNNLG